MHLRQAEFDYSACGPYTKNKKRIQKSKETGDSRNIYQSEPDKAYSQYDMAYEDFQNLPRRTIFDKVLRVNYLKLLKTQNMMDVKEVILQ